MLPKVCWDGKKRSLLDEIDVISSVSGRSIVAAHYALKSNEREPLMKIPTTLSPPQAEVDLLRKTARRTLRESPEMKRLLQDMRTGD